MVESSSLSNFWNHSGTPYARMAADGGKEEIVTEVVVPKGSESVRVGTTFECRRLASDGHRHLLPLRQSRLLWLRALPKALAVAAD